MLENSRAIYQVQRMTSHSNNSFSPFMMQNLLKEIQQQKHQLSKALSINNILVQRASEYHILLPSTLSSAQTWSNQYINQQNHVKMENEQSSEQIIVERRIRKIVKRVRNQQDGSQENHDKNQTKNIPKNYGKAILSFIQKNIQKYLHIIKPILQKGKLSIGDLLSHIKKHKKQVNSINYLKEMWGYQDRLNPILKCIRILSYIFMRKHCLSYIFNSRVKNYSTHIKYRKRVIQGIEHPQEFTCIKQF